MAAPSKTILDILFDRAYASLNQVAIELDQQTWTYGELLLNMTRVSKYLQVEKGQIIYQYVDRSFEMICGMLGIMYAGGVYCPLDPSDPSLYVRTLHDQIQGRHVLVRESTRERFLNTISDKIQIINLEHILLSNIDEEIPEKNIHIDIDSPSFIIYTFGTNRRQKIIVHTHKSLVAGLQNLILWNNKYGEKVLQINLSSWNMHLFEILIPLIMFPAGTLVLLPTADDFHTSHMCKTIEDTQITVLLINQTLLKSLIDYLKVNKKKSDVSLQSIRILLIFGESFRAEFLAEIKLFSSQTRIFLIFGMYETNAAIGREIKETNDELTSLSILPIGDSLAKYRCLLLDEDNDRRVIAPTDTNVIGQLYLSGAGLFQCYYNDPERTNSTRVLLNNEQFFKTGYLAQYNTKGELVHVGRIDSEIKINDRQVETTEVERIIMDYCTNEISKCLMVKLSQNEDLLVAYIAAGNSQLEPESIRHYCKDRLPKYMVPSYFVILDKVPLDKNGKVSIKQLPKASSFNHVPVPHSKTVELASQVAPELDRSLPNRKVSKGNYFINIVRHR